METVWQDVGFALRVLTKNPSFAAVAILTLALGMGANTAIFSVVKALLLKPLPYNDPERIVRVQETRPEGRVIGGLSTDNFQDWRTQTQTLEHMAAYAPQSFVLTGVDEPVRVDGVRVSPALFPLLEASPLLGRTLRRQEETLGHDRVIVLSHAFWQERLGGDRAILEKNLTLDGDGYTVVGVMDPKFEFPDRETKFWVPLALTPPVRGGNQRRIFRIPVVARLKAGVSIEQAQAEANTIIRRLREEDALAEPGARGGTIQLLTLQEQIASPIRPALLVLVAAVGFVLLIACANVANLLLARAAVRQKEIAIRSALGAGRGRLVRQLLTESVVLAVISGGLGLLLARWGLAALATFGPRDIPRLGEVSVDLGVLGFTAGISVLTGLLFGVVPAWQTSRVNLMQALKGEGGQADSDFGGFGRNRVRNLLAVAEIALALVLLVGAGLLFNSFLRLIRVDPGYDPNHVLALQIKLPFSKYPNGTDQVAFLGELLDRIDSLPQVESTGMANLLPLVRANIRLSVLIEGRPRPARPEDMPTADFRLVSPGLFEALGMRLVRGRLFTDGDREGTRPVVVVNEAFVRRYLADEEPLGRRVFFAGPEGSEIIGIVADVLHRGLDSEAQPEMYVPYPQRPGILVDQSMLGTNLAVRTSGDPLDLVPVLRSLVLSLDPEMPIYNVSTMSQRLSNSVARPRFYAFLLGVFSMLALVLAAVGIYGVMAYSVSQRTHEIGVRRALGAQTGDILRLVMGQGVVLTLLGIGLGLAGAWAVTRFLSTMLFGVSSTDVPTFAGVSLLLGATAAAACYIPARRATRVDPMVALRYE